MTLAEKIHPVLAFLLFHLKVGTRLAIRKLSPVLGTVFALFYVLRPEFFHDLISAFISSGPLFMGFFSSVVSLSTAAMVSPRICHGLDGWIRHLPSAARLQRRLASLAVFISQLPLLLLLALLAFYAYRDLEISASAYLLGIPILGLASAHSVLPVKPKMIIRPLAMVACVFSSSGNWVFLSGGIILLITADSLSSPLFLSKKPSRFQNALKGPGLYMTISWRALRLRIFIHYVLSLLVLGFAFLFIHNNELHSSLVVKSICLGGALSLTLFYALAANLLVARRPPWPWFRSLPLSAGKRILMDSLFLGIQTIPLLFIITVMNAKAVWPVVISLPPFTVYASYAIRQAPEFRTGAAGKILLYGMVGTLSIGLIPHISFAYMALTPRAFLYAVKAEQGQKVSRWHELHHLAAGDSLSWSK
jgi:hypothetical protein